MMECRSRPTVQDLARAAGVSVATVDRVLNQRHPVREATAARVLQAAQDLGYHATALLHRRLQADAPPRALGFLLQKRSDHFFAALGAALEAAVLAAPGVRGRPWVQYLDEIAPAAIARAVRDLGARVDALAVVSVDHPHVSHAIEALRERHVPCVALLSDLTAESRAGYVGLDGRRAGRTAAWAITRAARCEGEVGVLVGSHRFLGHELCEIGFRAYCREHAPGFQVLEATANLEDHRLAYEATIELLRRPDLVGIYVAGGGMNGVIQALRDEAAGRRIAMVCNELTPHTRAGLIDGVVTMVIATPVAALAAAAVEMMLGAAAAATPQALSLMLLGFEIYISENV